MAQGIIKPLANAETVSTTNTNITTAKLVHIFNGNAGPALIALKNSSAQYASLIIPAGEDVFVQKDPTDTLTSNATSTFAVKCAFTH
jgi:hypothetical protein